MSLVEQSSKRANPLRSTPAKQPSTKRSNKRQASSSPARGRQGQKTKPINLDDRSPDNDTAGEIGLDVTAPDDLLEPGPAPGYNSYPFGDGARASGFPMHNPHSADYPCGQGLIPDYNPFAPSMGLPSMTTDSGTYSVAADDSIPRPRTPRLAASGYGNDIEFNGLGSSESFFADAIPDEIDDVDGLLDDSDRYMSGVYPGSVCPGVPDY